MIARRPKQVARRLRTFDRDARQGSKWLLAMSIACPTCHNRLWGDGERVWCESYDCDFNCSWQAADDRVFSFNRNALPSELFRSLACHKECRLCPLR